MNFFKKEKSRDPKTVNRIKYFSIHVFNHSLVLAVGLGPDGTLSTDRRRTRPL